MRHLIIAPDFPPFISGIGDYTHRLAGAMSACGEHVDVLTLSDAEPSTEADPTGYAVRREIPEFTMSHLRHVVEVARDYDIVNIQYPGVHYGRSPMVNLLPAMLKRNRAAPGIVTIHDARVMRWRWRLRTWPMLNTVRGIIHVDPGDWPVLKSWLTFGEPPRACIPIASNVDVLPVDESSRAAWRASLGIRADEIACAYFGIIYPHKGLGELIDAVGQLRERGHPLRLVAIGDFDREADWRGPLEEKLKRDYVSWARGASLDRVSECLHASDLAALPFYSGTSTNRSSMLAALGHGLPVVTTDGPSTPAEIRELFDLELVMPEDVDSLRDGIERVLSDPKLAGRLRQSARVSATRVTWPAVAEATIAFHREVVDRGWA